MQILGKYDIEISTMWEKIIESKLCSETTFENFCTADDDIVESPLLDNSEIIKEVCQKAIESSDFDMDEENEAFEFISPAMAVFSLDIVRKFLVPQNDYTD